MSATAGLIQMGAAHIDAVLALDEATNPSPWTKGLFSGELDLDPTTRTWWVAVVGGDVVGFAGAMLSGEDAHLMGIAVAPGSRRRGIGRRLFDRTCVEAVQMGAKNLTLEVRENNTVAISLYEERGMHSVGKRPRYYSDGTDAVVMWWYDMDRVSMEESNV